MSMRVFLTFSAVGFQPAPGDQAGTHSKAETTSTKKTLGSVPWPNWYTRVLTKLTRVLLGLNGITVGKDQDESARPAALMGVKDISRGWPSLKPKKNGSLVFHQRVKPPVVAPVPTKWYMYLRSSMTVPEERDRI